MQNTTYDDTKFTDLENRIADLKSQIDGMYNDKEYTDLLVEEQLGEMNGLRVEVTIANIELKKAIIAIEQVEEIAAEAKAIKSQIFALMAVFFGIFAFITIDIQVVKGILNPIIEIGGKLPVDYTKKLTEIYVYTLGALIISQIIFFYAIYHVLIKPFTKDRKAEAEKAEAKKAKQAKKDEAKQAEKAKKAKKA